MRTHPPGNRGEDPAAVAAAGRRWTKTAKPWPAGIDEWSHWDHGPGRKARRMLNVKY